MAGILFYTTNIVTIIGCLIVGWGIFIHGRNYDKDLHVVRLFVAIVLTLLAVQRVSVFTIVWPKGVEVYASQPVILLCITFIVLGLGGTAVMGRRHHRNFALWVLLLLLPVVFLMVNAMMLLLGMYNPLFDRQEILEFRANTPSIYYGRMFFVAFLLFFWMLTVFMLIEAYIYDRHQRASRPLSEDAERHASEVRYVTGWSILLLTGLIPSCISSLWPYIIFNLILITALLQSALGYRRLIRYLRARDEGRLAPILIARRVPLLLEMEKGGTTAWSVFLQQNPFFVGNPLLDDVAHALDVKSKDLSAFLQSHDMNLVSWVSDQRLRHSAQLLISTDRKISEIAFSCGYNDLPTFTRAFRRQFGMAPSEYRKQEHRYR